MTPLDKCRDHADRLNCNSNSSSSLFVRPHQGSETVRRTGLPGKALKSSSHSRTTITPLTNTCLIPTLVRLGRSYVARSCTVAKSKMIRSASMPAWIRPFFFIWGTLSSRSFAGRYVLAIASDRLTALPSRTYLARNRVKVPALRGWAKASAGIGHASTPLLSAIFYDISLSKNSSYSLF